MSGTEICYAARWSMGSYKREATTMRYLLRHRSCTDLSAPCGMPGTGIRTPYGMSSTEILRGVRF
eukprot:3109594-Rhodomonas_salina.1